MTTQLFDRKVIVGPLKSISASRLSQATGWPRSWWQINSLWNNKWGHWSCTEPRPNDLLINYGLMGGALNRYYNKFPQAIACSTINKNIMSMESKCKTAQKLSFIESLTVPESRYHIGNAVSGTEREWIIKPTYSGQGRGIHVWDGESDAMHGEYFQQRITNREVEVRISGALWAPVENWGIWLKKHPDGNNQLTWNHDTGGKFVTVRRPENRRTHLTAIDNTFTILAALGLDFGAVDFIKDTDGRYWFLEVNTRPGFTPLSLTIYTEMFKLLEENTYVPIADR